MERLLHWRAAGKLYKALGDIKRRRRGGRHNCVHFYPTKKETETWYEWQCYASPRGCPCTVDFLPLIHLRGFCPDTDLEHYTYKVTQSATDPNNIIMVGYQSARIQYDSSLSQWVYSDQRLNMTAMSKASQNSFVLGKHKWTLSGDKFQCPGGKEYTLEMKLTGCRNTQFTCDDGQCVKMKERCDQVPQCEDQSEEQNCKVLILQHGYNKKVPPHTHGVKLKKNIKKHRYPVKVSLNLQKVIAIKEVDYSISFKFKIILKWYENRVTYQNLKNDSTTNLLTQEEVKMLWLPLVIYWNTDQDETTRLGENWEWKTDISVEKEGEPKRNHMTDIDEAEIFQGSENSLKMEQTYTHVFQCVFQLSIYPFDTQVSFIYLQFRTHFDHPQIFFLPKLNIFCRCA